MNILINNNKNNCINLHFSMFIDTIIRSCPFFLGAGLLLVVSYIVFLVPTCSQQNSLYYFSAGIMFIVSGKIFHLFKLSLKQLDIEFSDSGFNDTSHNFCRFTNADWFNCLHIDLENGIGIEITHSFQPSTTNISSLLWPEFLFICFWFYNH